MEEISPRSRQDSEIHKHHGEISTNLGKIEDIWQRSRISPRLPRSHHDVCEILNLGEIAARYPPSRRDLWRSHHVCEFLNLGEIAVRFPPSR